MSDFKEFVKKEFVVIIAAVAALISCALVPVTDYTQYVDTDVLGTLFSLMLIIAGLRGNNVLAKMTSFIVRKAHIEDTRRALAVISVLTFFVSMFVTNDAALIALVPITIVFFFDYPSLMVYAIVVQTVAANLGSMVTPFGNPQNLLIFSSYEISAAEFFKAALPVGAFSFILILILCLFMKRQPLIADNEVNVKIVNKRYTLLYFILFVLVLFSVFGYMNILVAFASVCVVIIIIEPKRFLEIDYGLLVTFVLFFIFVGNMQHMAGVNEFVEKLLDEKEFIASVLVSQVISNVPAAVMLTGFTDNWKAIMLGTDIGGLGTPIASLASLISLRIYGDTENPKMLRYIGIFSLVNFVLLGILCVFAMVVLF